jgi:UDP-N-acetylglucosamine--dolichyl-phosphate N-acetylglucosaminephosphotransferase
MERRLTLLWIARLMPSQLATYLSALLSLLSSLILGFCDDVFDIRWRFKMPIPIISSIPMLLVYYAGRGGTGLVVPGWPGWLRTAVGSRVVDLGLFYYVYMALLSVFCTHSINILAGINGVEVGQALIIAFSLCLNDALYLPFTSALLSKEKTSDIYWLSNVNPIQNELVGRHLFSLSLMLPLVGTCAGLLAWNRHPSLVFVGDTFCYFAGQALACAGVLGHFSKTLLLFFLPQVFNFLLSCPQLFGFVPCPRHRVPGVHRETMGLFPSVAVFTKKKRIGTLGTGMLLILETLKLVKLYREGEMQAFEARLAHKDSGDQLGRGQEQEQGQEQGKNSRRIVGTTNLTLLNSLLVLKGSRTPLEHVLNELRKADADADVAADSQVVLLEIPSPSPSCGQAVSRAQYVHIDEPRLWRLAMGTQLLGSAIAFAVRYWAAAIVFPDQ